MAGAQDGTYKETHYQQLCGMHVQEGAVHMQVSVSREEDYFTDEQWNAFTQALHVAARVLLQRGQDSMDV